MESLIIDLIAGGLIDAKIDEQNQVIIVERADSRCIPNSPESLQSINDQIAEIRARISTALDETQ